MYIEHGHQSALFLLSNSLTIFCYLTFYECVCILFLLNDNYSEDAVKVLKWIVLANKAIGGDGW